MLESDRKVMCFSVIFMEIVNIMHCIEAKVFTSWTRREGFLLDLLTIQWSSYRMNFGFKPWEMVDASTQGSVPRPVGEQDRSDRWEQVGTVVTQHLTGIFFQLELQNFVDFVAAGRRRWSTKDPWCGFDAFPWCYQAWRVKKAIFF